MKNKKMGYGKVGVSKERMCSYKHTHNGAVHTDKELLKEAQNIIDAVKENPNTIDNFTGKPISQETLEKARIIVKAFTIIIDKKEKRLAKGETPESIPE